ncbi:hypothetical protein G7B40_032385 [Aetokthonos hydrillicola Thurmond2011]|jgi:hypothetical protein|uniref:Uncharacterized protein n=1 Tax=Aetokthonos hydrillicola Thurmond2011 TaxID=2712845 RepID=A0AAP5MDE5_9CYAN|nr:hypothetical protein [Aetokthonos hydrillicola]MBW4585720.1 hypothetical protein [Aetokthonos hydrillicola CCALA 1050]MDR9899224.1 hypothetical protein [Aetokthonos hydrillicola Thurmond2011]
MFDSQITTTKPQQTTISVQPTNPQYQVDITTVLLQHPSTPFAIALSISIVLGTIARLIKTLKSP